jgi:Fe2+ or Zn2+ uptake regulation protein
VDVAAITRERLAAQSQRATPARLRLAEAVAHAHHPVTIAEILDAEPSFALSSTYRNLTVLEQAGIIHRVITTEDVVRYELAEPLADHHHHLMCEGCGVVIDVPLADLERAVHDAAAAVAISHSFRTTAHRIDLIGRCERCA